MQARFKPPVGISVEGLLYPSTLITTGDHDDRVVPMHSYKFCASLQEKKGREMRVYQDTGHGAGRSVNQQIGEGVDFLKFLIQETR